MTHKIDYKRLCILLLLGTLVGCVGAPTVSVAVPTPKAANLSDITTLKASEIKSIHIVDDWDGLSPAAPFSAEYVLTRDGDGLSGRLTVALGGRNSVRQNVTETLNVPLNIIEQFVHTLGTAKVGPVVTKPRPTITDSYGQLSINITLSTNRIDLFRPNGGTDDLWYVSFTGSGLGMIEDGIPTVALQGLRPYLKQDVIDKLVNGMRFQ